LVKRLCEVYAQRRPGKKYPFDGHAAKNVGQLLGLVGDPEAIALAWSAALAHRGFPSVESLQELVQHLPRFLPAQETPPAASRSRPGTVWGAVLARLEQEGKTYALGWLERMHQVACTDDVLTLGAPDEHFLGWVRDHYGATLERMVAPRKLRVVVAQQQPPGPAPPLTLVAQDVNPTAVAGGT
jgi:hypothetical protein